jgi:hypothetical protein
MKERDERREQKQQATHSSPRSADRGDYPVERGRDIAGIAPDIRVRVLH